MSLAEKFQITVPAKVDGGAEYASFDSVRVSSPAPDCFMPSENLTDEVSAGFVQGFGGDTDVSGGVNGKIMEKGFARKHMKGTDDQYSGEHIDLFYGEVQDEKGNVGFVERNNYLDRL